MKYVYRAMLLLSNHMLYYTYIVTHAGPYIRINSVIFTVSGKQQA